MSTYSYQNWLYVNVTTAPVALMAFGTNEVMRVYFAPPLNQILIQNGADFGFTICYSGRASTYDWEGTFSSSPKGQVKVISAGEQAYFNNGIVTKEDPAFSPRARNMYVICDRIVIMCDNEPDVSYEFNFKLEPISSTSTKTSIMWVGDRLLNGKKDDS